MPGRHQVRGHCSTSMVAAHFFASMGLQHKAAQCSWPLTCACSCTLHLCAKGSTTGCKGSPGLTFSKWSTTASMALTGGIPATLTPAAFSKTCVNNAASQQSMV